MITLEEYDIGSLIYESSESLIYRGHRLQDKRSVIFKTLKSEYPTQAETQRLNHEFETTKSILNPDGHKLYEITRYGNNHVLILEDIGARSLDMIKHIPYAEGGLLGMPVENLLALAIKISNELQKIHTAFIIHKDINLSNIIWNHESGQLNIIDFSISTKLSREHLEIRSPNKLEGSLAYISPEQTGRVNRPIDNRTDLYSMGITLYELFSGQLPFEAQTPLEWVHCHIAKIPEPLCDIAPEIPKIISDIVMKLMSKNVEDRYQSADGVKTDLIKCQEYLIKNKDLGDFTFELAQLDFSGRFQIPQKLYGRDEEIARLTQAFDRICNGTTELMLIKGYPGVGKTSIVREIHKRMTQKSGFFAAGKFDQYQRNIPYSAITQAMSDFCHYLLMESADSLEYWRNKIQEAVGQNGQIIIDVIPDLELIIGKQPAVAKMGATEVQNRFNLYFLKFFKALCNRDHPFILFVDDLQWVDSASLDLLKSILLDDGIKYLLIIGAYRDNHVQDILPINSVVGELKKTNATVHCIELESLQPVDINHLLQDSLNNKTNFILPLTDLIYQKTQGNAFFTHQFLQKLYEDRLLQFDFEYNEWQWDIEQISSQNITDNVVELMTTKIKKLPEKTSAVMQIAACIGNQFDLETLSIVYQNSQAATLDMLWKAMEENFILPLDDNYKRSKHRGDRSPTTRFKFQHDRIQEAAYSLIAESERLIFHRQIGNFMKEMYKDDLENRIFEIVDHLNLGIEEVITLQEKNDVIELNLQAGNKAKLANAYRAASRYLTNGINFLPQNSWQSDYTLTLNLHLEAVEVELLIGHFEKTDELIQLVLQHANTLLDQFNAYEFRIHLYIAKNQIQDAMDTSLRVLEMLGIDLEKNPPDNQFLESDSSLSEMASPDKLIAMRILNIAISPSYMVAPELFPQIVFTMVKLSLEYGNSPLAVFGFACYGLLLCGQLGDIESGYRAGQLAINLLDRLNAKEEKAKGFAAYYATIHHWKKHARESIAAQIEGCQSGLETGDLEFAGVNAMHYASFLFWVGEPLKTVTQQHKKYHALLKSTKREFSLTYLKVWQQTALNLQGLNSDPCRLIGEAFNEDERMPGMLKAKNFSMVNFCVFLSKTMLCYLFEDFPQAVANGALATAYEKSTVGIMVVPIYKFYYSLALLATYPDSSADSKSNIIQQVNSSLELMKLWAFHGPVNYLHRYYLIEAEKANILGELDAIEWYEKSIINAKENKYFQEAALAYELASRFYQARDMEKISQTYMKEAFYLYEQWGAKAKVMQLENKYPYLSATKSSQISIKQKELNGSNNSSFLNATILDIETVLKSSHALSSEIMLGELLKKMMSIVIENAGADRGALLLAQKGVWHIEAEINTGNENIVSVLNSIPLEDSNKIALSPIHYAIRSNKPVLISDDLNQVDFSQDPYILNNHPRSILCMPMHNQGVLTGVLYLENRVVAGVFTPERLELLKILSSQIAISIENARLYRTLEDKVEERSRELKNAQSQLIQSAKLASIGELATGVAHELNQPLAYIRGETQLELSNGMENLEKESVFNTLQTIEEGTFRMEKIISHLREFAHQNRTETPMEPTNINDVLESSFLMLGKQLEDHGISIVIDISENLALIQGNPYQLEQVFINLLLNSRDALINQKNPELQIHASQVENKVIVYFQDNGSGIPQNIRTNIFDPFFTTKEPGMGTGLGLSISYGIIRDFGGEISLDETRMIGTTMKLALPVA